MKKFTFIFFASALLIFTSAKAFDFNNLVEEVDKVQTTADKTKSATSSGNVVSGSAIDKIAEKEVKKITDQIQKSVQKQLDDYKKMADQQVGKINDLVKSELGNIETMIKDVTKQVKFFETIKARITFYIRLAIIVGTILASIIVFLILMIFVLWFKVRRLENKC